MRSPSGFLVEADGFFCTQDPELGFEIHAGSLAAAKGRAVEAGIAAGMIDELVARLRAAKAGGYEWVTSPFLLDLVLRKPQPMRRPGGRAQPPAR